MNNIRSLLLFIARFSYLLFMGLALTYMVMPIKWIFAGAPVADTSWGTTYEADPTGSDPLSQGDDWFRQLKKDIRRRAAVEHNWGALSGAPTTDTGRHLEGSARAFYEAACPSVLPRGDYNNSGGASSTLLDSGRICRDSVTGELKINSTDGSATWVQALTALSGTINLINTPRFTTSGADSMTLHAHAARHRLSGSAGAWTNALDGVLFAIQDITTDLTVKAACGTGVPTTALTSQVFGDAGAGTACLSLPLNTTGRTSTNTKMFVIATLVFNNDSVAAECDEVHAGIYYGTVGDGIVLVSTKNPVGDTSACIPGLDGEHCSMTMVGYISTVAAANNEVAVHAIGDDANECDVVSGDLFVIDLGNG